MFEKIYVNFIEKGIPVYMGEFGCVNRATEREQAFQQYYLKYFTKAAKSYGVPCFIWDNGADGAGNECHAFIDHATGEYSSAGAEAAIRAMTIAYRSDYSLEDIYNQAPIF
jgi:endoglucanase